MKICKYQKQDKDKDKEKVALIIAQALKNNEGNAELKVDVPSNETGLILSPTSPDQPDKYSDQQRKSSGTEMTDNGN